MGSSFKQFDQSNSITESQRTMNLVDNFKLRALIEESISSFNFLDSVKVQDDISSELAGFEISKLLKNQQDNERRYAELVKKRATLTKITQKQQLNLVQAEIAKLSMILKESTKKLCKLFKENPDLQKDSFKVSRQRKALILKLEQLIEFIKNNSTAKFQTFITHELQSQDQMRRLMEKQKKLNMEIKKLQQEKMAESKEYQKEIAQNMARIQEFKQNLMDKSQKSEIQITYFEKQSKAELSNKRRIFQQSEKALSIEIQNLRSTIKTETLVHKQLEQYLHRKNGDIKKRSEELTTKAEQSRDKLDQQINQLNELIQKTNQELEVFKKRYQEEEERKLEREKRERRKMDDKKNKEEELIRLNNAIKYIQNEYLAWKEAGGGKKKKKKK